MRHSLSKPSMSGYGPGTQVQIAPSDTFHGRNKGNKRSQWGEKADKREKEGVRRENTDLYKIIIM